MTIGSSLAASSSSESASFSVPLLLLAAAVDVAWVLLLTAFLAWRRPGPAKSGRRARIWHRSRPQSRACCATTSSSPPISLPRIRSWRVRRDFYAEHAQSETVAAAYTPNLGYVRELRHPLRAPST